MDENEILGSALFDSEARFLQFGSVEKASNGKTRAVISSRSVDRMGDIVEPQGGDFADYLRNPVVLFGHDFTQPPVGRCVDLQANSEDIRAEIQWAPTPKGNELKALYESGFMSGFSIGFKPLERPGATKQGGLHFKRWKLLEFSAVSIPANQDALAYGKSLTCAEMRHGLDTNHARHFDSFDFDEQIKSLRLLVAAGFADCETMFDGRTKILRYHDHDGNERTVIQHS